MRSQLEERESNRNDNEESNYGLELVLFYGTNFFLEEASMAKISKFNLKKGVRICDFIVLKQERGSTIA